MLLDTLERDQLLEYLWIHQAVTFYNLLTALGHIQSAHATRMIDKGTQKM